MNSSISSSVVNAPASYPLELYGQVARQMESERRRAIRGEQRAVARRSRVIGALNTVIANTDDTQLKQLAVQWLKHVIEGADRG
ncbi:hypothetical protein PSEG_01555 [Pseudomonas sp. Nvir]|jgi:hypothetical protein|nr:hypothetical protein PSNVIR_01033 [Pseudomonas sp. Nvir]